MAASLPVRPKMPTLSSARYGKDNVRVLKRARDEASGTQTVTEMTVSCLLEGDISTSYTEADNSVVVATDSIKNTIYIKAKEHPVTPPELYASVLGTHFLDTYPHIHAANIKVVTHRWTRIPVDSNPHRHSFYRDGQDTRDVDARISRADGIELTSGIAGLTVLKSTGSAFHSFVRDEYTTLPEVWDRILSTDVDCGWAWRFEDLKAVEAAVPKFDKAFDDARGIIMKTFAEDSSASVQNTMYKMCEQILAAAPDVRTVRFSLPNKHYFEVGKFLRAVLLGIRVANGGMQISAGTRGSRIPARMPRSSPPSPVLTALSSVKYRAHDHWFCHVDTALGDFSVAESLDMPRSRLHFHTVADQDRGLLDLQHILGYVFVDYIASVSVDLVFRI
ncbi:urate oxidase [Candidatus Bathyarchaeota archaeon]|nr:urate oxidase [Candidatus Bathyarchaeota archaeon]